MEVNELETIRIDDEHSIEFGQIQYGDDWIEVIRRRKNNENGSYDPISSSIIPIEPDNGIGRLFLECLRTDRISIAEMQIIANEISASNIRQNP